jgi:beta-lactamase superfamily II metal-dependent hydrolase
MTDVSTARSVLWPNDTKVVVRICFLYVGQGSSLLFLVRDGNTYRTLVADCNLDEGRGGIDVAALLKDLTTSVYAFINTHPHDDHLRGVKEIAEAVTVERVWHSGHKPGRKAGNYYGDLTDLIADVKKRNGEGAVAELEGSRSEKPLLDASMYVLAPAVHVCDDVNDEDPDTRYSRIHENCAVFRIGKDPSWVLVTGDADLVAFRDHITEYHSTRLPSFLLDASHHGSRSFFKKDKDDEPFLDALKKIAPTYLVISAPTADDSPFEHPHDDALKLYADQVGESNIFHTGAECESFYFDIYENGTHSGAQTDSGALAEAYGLHSDEDDDDGGGGAKKGAGPFIRPSKSGTFKPRKYG